MRRSVVLVCAQARDEKNETINPNGCAGWQDHSGQCEDAGNVRSRPQDFERNFIKVGNARLYDEGEKKALQYLKWFALISQGRELSFVTCAIIRVCEKSKMAAMQ